MPKSKSLGIRLRIETKDALDRFAARNGISVSSWVEDVLLERLHAAGEIPKDEVVKPRRRQCRGPRKPVRMDGLAA